MSKLRKDLTDYLETPEAQAILDRVHEQLQLDVYQNPEKYWHDMAGTLDPMKIERERQWRRQSAIEEMAADLPDEYLSEEELADRKARLEPYEDEADDEGWDDPDLMEAAAEFIAMMESGRW